MNFIGSNPLLSDSRLLAHTSTSSTMTVAGTVTKTFVLFVILLIAAATSWRLAVNNPSLTGYLLIGASIAALLAAMIGIFSPKTTVITGPMYAAFKGLALGAISMMYDAQSPGIAGQAMVLTLGVMLVMLGMYGSGIIRASNTLVKVISVGLSAIMVSYVVSFFIGPIPYLHDNSTFGILFSLAIVILAALSFVLDFDRIERGAQAGAPKYMEWYGALSLLITLVWLYLNMIRLLSKLRNRS